MILCDKLSDSCTTLYFTNNSVAKCIISSQHNLNDNMRKCKFCAKKYSPYSAKCDICKYRLLHAVIVKQVNVEMNIGSGTNTNMCHVCLLDIVNRVEELRITRCVKYLLVLKCIMHDVAPFIAVLHYHISPVYKFT